MNATKFQMRQITTNSCQINVLPENKTIQMQMRKITDKSLLDAVLSLKASSKSDQWNSNSSKLCSPWEPKHQSIRRTVLQLWVPQIEPWLKHLFPEYCFLYLLQKCHFKYTVYVSLYLYLYVEELFALTENNNKKWRLALPCVLRSHDYHVTGGANQNADMQIKTKQKKKR